MKKKTDNNNNNNNNHLVLFYSLDSNTISIGLINCNICIAKLAMAQQFSNRIPVIEILFIPKVRSLPTWNRHIWPSYIALHVLRRMPLFLLILCFMTWALLFFRRKCGTGFGGCLRRRLLAVVVVDVHGGSGDGAGVGIGTTHLLRGITDTHFQLPKNTNQSNRRIFNGSKISWIIETTWTHEYTESRGRNEEKEKIYLRGKVKADRRKKRGKRWWRPWSKRLVVQERTNLALPKISPLTCDFFL